MLPHYTIDPKFLKRFWSHVEKSEDGCWLWTAGRFNSGYGQISRRPTHHCLLTHRVAWELAYGPIPDGMFVCHHCDNKICVRPDHLFLGTSADNHRDMCNKGRQVFPPWVPGEKQGASKLTEADVLAIRVAHAAGKRYATLGRTYGVYASTVADVCNRKTWRHIP